MGARQVPYNSAVVVHTRGMILRFISGAENLKSPEDRNRMADVRECLRFTNDWVRNNGSTDSSTTENNAYRVRVRATTDGTTVVWNSPRCVYDIVGKTQYSAAAVDHQTTRMFARVYTAVAAVPRSRISFLLRNATGVMYGSARGPGDNTSRHSGGVRVTGCPPIARNSTRIPTNIYIETQPHYMYIRQRPVDSRT